MSLAMLTRHEIVIYRLCFITTLGNLVVPTNLFCKFSLRTNCILYDEKLKHRTSKALTTQALGESPNVTHDVIEICAPAAPPIMLRIGTHSLNPNPRTHPNPNPIFNRNRNKVFERKQNRTKMTPEYRST